MCVLHTHTHTTSLAEAFESIYRPHDTSFHVSASKNKDPPHVNRVLHLSIVRKLRILKYNQLACYMYHFPYLILHKISTVLASGWLKITFPFASLSPSLKATTINKILSICSEKYCMYIFAYIHFFKWYLQRFYYAHCSCFLGEIIHLGYFSSFVHSDSLFFNNHIIDHSSLKSSLTSKIWFLSSYPQYLMHISWSVAETAGWSGHLGTPVFLSFSCN